MTVPGAAQFLATARTDERDWLVEADEPLAGLQLRCGGELPGIVAPPALLELVQKARRQGVRLSREIEARDALETVTAWVEVQPDGAGGGCTISVAEWRAARLPDEDHHAIEVRRAAVERHLAELTARLGPGQEVVAVDCESPELSEVAERLRTGRGKRWTELVEVADDMHRHSGNWRLLDGVRVAVPGSARSWKAVLLPLGRSQKAPAGFELLLVAVEAPAEAGKQPARESLFGATIGREIAPVLFQPMSRIIANADTIRTQLAGPLSEEYSKYAADIATAGEHLMALVDDLVDLEAVEADDFDTAIERIDLADAVRRAAGVLSARAHEREIVVEVPADHEQVLAIGESRRVLQILLNVLGNALRYCPPGSQVSLRAEQAGDRARITVADHGEGLTREQQARVFDKFERLGRGEDGGSGLGLYISRRLARAMGGDLSVESAPGQGARFILELPAFEVET
jgi:signal transduction histidine kinase